MFAGTHPGAADRAVALSPTPAPFDIEWSVEIAGEPIAGHTVRVSFVATPVNGGRSYGGMAKKPAYRLTIESDSAPLELTTAADVSPDDVLDGAEWEVRALHDGEATLTVRLDYKLSYCITGTPCGSYNITDSTTATVTVTALLGDTSCDGSIDPRDAALVLQLEAGLLETLSCDAGDTNDDGLTNSLDAGMILQHSAGLLPDLEGQLTG
jgi:hypothetical protein